MGGGILPWHPVVANHDGVRERNQIFQELMSLLAGAPATPTKLPLGDKRPSNIPFGFRARLTCRIFREPQ